MEKDNEKQMSATRQGPPRSIPPAQQEVPEFLMQFFAYKHLPPKLQLISQPFGEIADQMMKQLPRNPERTTMLRKLLEAKDCAVRAAIAQ